MYNGGAHAKTNPSDQMTAKSDDSYLRHRRSFQGFLSDLSLFKLMLFSDLCPLLLRSTYISLLSFARKGFSEAT